ncbi:MAG TPA: alpha/beta hydrolase [Solirubrobacterales bacterium]|nr:alpha/beta hydrolase [Solirubrobacterales bacterium]
MDGSGSFRYQGHRIAYEIDGEGKRTLVLVHGLLMNRRMYDKLAPELASRGNRVITVDLLGHGDSDKPDDMRMYSMNALAGQVAALVDHLGLEAPVVGGTSLGANVTLELAVHHPESARGLFIEMPVLEDALLGAALVFTPILLGLRFGKPLLAGASRALQRIPRTNYLLDIMLDWLRRDPDSSRAVLEGVLFAGAAPPREERRGIAQPALVIGHPNDPLHPFSDADILVEEMQHARLVNANSILEWRLTPKRLDGELAAFLDEVYASGADEARSARAASG